MTTDVAAEPVVVPAERIGELPVEPLGNQVGVVQRVLWKSEISMAGILTVDAGCRLGLHTHRTNHHHMYVLAGRALILGEMLAAGSYAHIPSGVEHDIDASTTEGCTVYYLYLRHA